MWTSLQQHNFWIIALGVILLIPWIVDRIHKRASPLIACLRSRNTPLIFRTGLIVCAVGFGLLVKQLNDDPSDHHLVDVDPPPVPIAPSPKPKLPSDVLLSAWSAHELNWPVIELMAQLSQTVYDSPVETRNKFKELGFPEFEVCLDASMAAYVLKGENVTVLVFRGTDDTFDWVNNLRHGTFAFPEGGMHRGFWEGYVPLGRQINMSLAQDRSKPIWITGHSLGGALAAICAFERELRLDSPIAGLVTFGQPRFSDAKLTELLNRDFAGRYLRVVNEADAVPRMPPNFKYCGSLLWFNNGKLTLETQELRMMAGSSLPRNEAADQSEPPVMSQREFLDFQQRVKREQAEPKFDAEGHPLMQGAGNLPWIENHLMANYLEKIRAYAK